MADFAEQRTNMVESQVRPSDVTDRRVIRAMLALPRERFVPAERRPVAYMDDDIAVSASRRLIAPRVLARMIQAAEIEDGTVVLDVGCATGYSSAILSRIAQTVVALEQDAGLARAAGEIMTELGIDNVAVVSGAHAAGVAGEGPFDAILVAGSIPEAPKALLDQLKDGGRLVALVAEGPLCWVTVYQRIGMAFDTQKVFTAGGPAMPGFERQVEFVL